MGYAILLLEKILRGVHKILLYSMGIILHGVLSAISPIYCSIGRIMCGVHKMSPIYVI